MTPLPTPELDFTAIRQQYPAAFAALMSFVRHRADLPPITPAVVYTWLERYPRALYDFFDQQGVCCVVMPIALPVTQFWACVFVGNYANATRPGTFPTRNNAETAAFTAAFGKLEEVLKQKEA